MHTLASRRSVATPNSASLVRSPARLLISRHLHPRHLTIPPLTATWPHPYQFLNLLHTRLPLRLLHLRLLLRPLPVVLIADLRLLLLGPITNSLPLAISFLLTQCCASPILLFLRFLVQMTFSASTIGRWNNTSTLNCPNSLNWNLSLRFMAGVTFPRSIF